MLGDFIARASEARAASGSLSFSDVASIALRTLESDLGLRDWYKGRYDAIMVDEFQDDNDLQKRILYCIAERRNLDGADRKPEVSPADLEPGLLFFVGDEKQSIYAFRGADVTVFRGLSTELASAPGGSGEHSLNINWRSEPGLIEFFNQTFARVLPAPDDPAAQDYEARFSGLLAGPATPGVEPAVMYLESNEPDDDDALASGEAEAWRIAELVRSLVDGKTIVAAKGPGGSKVARACQWEDIAVLFRSTTSQNVVERYFRLLKVPYTAASTAGLFAESILGDLYAMLRLAVYPDDRLAFATVLRGPFARLSDDAVFKLLSPGASGPDGLMGFDAADLPAADAVRFAAARESWLGVRSIADREPLRRVLEYLWYDRGLRWNVLREPASASFLEHFDYAWSLAAAADARGERLVDLVSSLEPKIGKLDRFDEAVLRESSRGVSIMTVHMSKGLEFPVVILPDADARGMGDTKAPVAPGGRFGPSVRLLDGHDDPYDPVAELASAMKKYESGKDEDAMNERLAETARLFYVACTRAISRLYLVGKVPRNADKSGQSFRALFLRAWPWAGPASMRDEEFMSDRPEGVPSSLSVAYVASRAKAGYARLANVAGSDGADRAEASATAPTHTMVERKGRWSVTGAAAFLEAETGHLKNPQDEALVQASIRSPDMMESPQLFLDLSIDPTAEPGLTEAEFGTLCHQYIEAGLQRPAEEPVASGSVARALERLPAAIAKRDQHQAHSLADSFARSPRGVSAKAARAAVLAGEAGAIFETEYPFVWRNAPSDAGSWPVVLSGSIDLVYGDAEGIQVIDFKTDRLQEPERHAFQLSIYRDAAESIFGKKARAAVHYLRTGIEYEFPAAPDISRLEKHS
jgi:ATP-dependent helicase/nuclease subunit A